MFRSDRDALADKVDDLRSENDRLRVENDAMRRDLLAARAGTAGFAPRNVYQTATLDDGERAALTSHRLRAQPIWSTVVAHVLTLGVASFLRFNAMHDQLPRAAPDDPSAAKAIGLHFVPYFNMYWVFWNGLRLADRLNLQLRARGEAPRIERSLVIAAAVVGIVPYVNFVIGPFVWLAVAIQMQRAINHVVALDEARAAAPSEAATRVAPYAEAAPPDPVRVAPQVPDPALAEVEALADEEAEAAAARRAAVP